MTEEFACIIAYIVSLGVFRVPLHLLLRIGGLRLTVDELVFLRALQLAMEIVYVHYT